MTADHQAHRGSGWEAMHCNLAADAVVAEALLYASRGRRLTVEYGQHLPEQAYRRPSASPAAGSSSTACVRPAGAPVGGPVRTVREVTTAELRVGDVVDWRGEGRHVAEVRDTGSPAAYGEGTAFDVTLVAADGREVPLQAASSQRWLRL